MLQLRVLATQKLEEVIQELLAGALLGDVQATGFLPRSVTTRNYLMHRDLEAVSKACGDADFYLAGCVWQEVIYALLLGRAGLSADEIIWASAMMRWKRGTLRMVGKDEEFSTQEDESKI